MAGAGLVAALSYASGAKAILLSGAPVPNTGLLATFQILNTSGSTQATNFITPIFGHPFKAGDIPSGTYPIFKLDDNTVCSYSVSSSLATWADGSLKFAAFMLLVPTSISGNGTININVYSGGSAPAASSRALSDFAASSLDLNVTGTGKDNLSGAWASNLNQGVSAANADNYVYMDGAAGKVWRIRAPFRQSAADHGQLEGYWYVAALSNSGGTLGGIRYLCAPCQPWYNVTSPAPQFRSFSALAVNNGASQIRDLVAAMPAAKTFTWSGSGVTLNSTGHGMQTGLPGYLTTTGTLPAGLSTNQIYCFYKIDANSFCIGLGFQAVVINGGGSCITPTDAGTGTHTITLLPMVSAYGSIFTAETNGRMSYIQGGGSVAADSTVLVQPNTKYWSKTGALPPYAYDTFSPSSNASWTYFPDTGGPFLRDLGTTGERDDLGPLPAYYARHAFTKAAVDEQMVRVGGLIGASLPLWLKDHTTKSIPVANNTTYTGMPAHNSNFRWDAESGDESGFTAPSNTNVWTQGWSDFAMDHMPQWFYYPYLLTGEPQFMDLNVLFANAALYTLYPGSGTAVTNGSSQTIGAQRVSSISGTTRYGLFRSPDLERTVAWGTGAMAGFFITPDTNPENASYAAYFTDIVNDTYIGSNDYITMLSGANSFATTNGMWEEKVNSGNDGAMWTTGYRLGTTTLLYSLTGNSHVKDFLNYRVKWPAYLNNTLATWVIGYYSATVRTGPNFDDPYIPSLTGFSIGLFSYSWNAGGFTIITPPPHYTLANNDKVIFNDVAPSGFSIFTAYYIINYSGGTFKLSATKGGSAINPGDTGSDSGDYLPDVMPSTGSNSDTIPDGYVANIYATMAWAKAAGLTVDATTLTGLNAIITAIPGYVASYNGNPKYGMQPTYA
jgi:hypothetical protein